MKRRSQLGIKKFDPERKCNKQSYFYNRLSPFAKQIINNMIRKLKVLGINSDYCLLNEHYMYIQIDVQHGEIIHLDTGKIVFNSDAAWRYHWDWTLIETLKNLNICVVDNVLFYFNYSWRDETIYENHRCSKQKYLIVVNGNIVDKGILHHRFSTVCNYKYQMYNDNFAMFLYNDKDNRRFFVYNRTNGQFLIDYNIISVDIDRYNDQITITTSNMQSFTFKNLEKIYGAI